MGKREKADAYERAMVSETGVKSRDVLTSSALRRLSEELACFSERLAERFGEGKVSSSRDTSEIEVAYAEICGMAALDGLDATERKNRKVCGKENRGRFGARGSARSNGGCSSSR